TSDSAGPLGTCARSASPGHEPASTTYAVATGPAGGAAHFSVTVEPVTFHCNDIGLNGTGGPVGAGDGALSLGLEPPPPPPPDGALGAGAGGGVGLGAGGGGGGGVTRSALTV